jgi:hypothetical protein
MNTAILVMLLEEALDIIEVTRPRREGEEDHPDGWASEKAEPVLDRIASLRSVWASEWDSRVSSDPECDVLTPEQAVAFFGSLMDRGGEVLAYRRFSLLGSVWEPYFDTQYRLLGYRRRRL